VPVRSLIDGVFYSEPILNRSVLGFTSDRKVWIDNVTFDSWIVVGQMEIPVSGINRSANAGEIIVYTVNYGRTSFSGEFQRGIWINDDVVQGIIGPYDPVPASGWVVGAAGSKASLLSDVRQGDSLSFGWRILPEHFSTEVVHAIGAGPRLVRNGEVLVTASEEQFKDDVVEGRAPRTAAGVTANNHLLLVVVNGRRPDLSVGMTLVELAEFMLELGAIDAINLDGGGSSTMSIYGRAINLPSDGDERKISNGIVVTR
jgi:hypothetical protein